MRWMGTAKLRVIIFDLLNTGVASMNYVIDNGPALAGQDHGGGARERHSRLARL